MPISVSCGACHKKLSVKEEYAGKRVRCPACKQPLRIPEPEPVDEWDVDEYDDLPVPATPSRTRGADRKSSTAGSRGFAGNVKRWWYLLTIGFMLLMAFFFPKAGLVISGLIAFGGFGLALVAGLIPIFTIVVKDPATVLTMIVSRSARFEMMRQPDNHPYKQLVRNTGLGTRHLMWKGLLLAVAFIPAAVLSSNSPMGRAGGGHVAAPEHMPPNMHFVPGAGAAGENNAGVPAHARREEMLQQRHEAWSEQMQQRNEASRRAATAGQDKGQQAGQSRPAHIPLSRIQELQERFGEERMARVDMVSPLPPRAISPVAQHLGRAGGAQLHAARKEGQLISFVFAPIEDFGGWVEMLDLGPISEINSEERSFKLRVDFSKLGPPE